MISGFRENILTMNKQWIDLELARLNGLTDIQDARVGIGCAKFRVRCPFEAQQVLLKAQSVLITIGQYSFPVWPEEEMWRKLLPSWFIAACSSSPTQAEAEKWLEWWQHLSPSEQIQSELTKNWSLDSWLYWMEPENRQWVWGEAKFLSDCDDFLVVIEVESWPFSWGAFRWLLRAAGASTVEPEPNSELA